MTTTWTHIPILAQQIADLLLVNPDGVYVDGTLGLGGHTRCLLARLGASARIFGLDKDAEALEIARTRVNDDRLKPVHSSYTEAANVLHAAGISSADGLLLDLGLSSYQLDNPARGFSMLQNGPLDMRFDLNGPLKAADIVNTWPLHEITRILQDYGEEHHAEKIARAILEARKQAPIQTTQQLAQIVEEVLPRYGKKHPATQTFQALRIACNGELESVERVLHLLDQIIHPGGRVAVLTFHSLEDRLVKNNFKKLAQSGSWRLVNKHALAPDYEEVRQNHRARSAKLRVIERVL